MVFCLERSLMCPEYLLPIPFAKLFDLLAVLGCRYEKEPKVCLRHSRILEIWSLLDLDVIAQYDGFYVLDLGKQVFNGFVCE